MFIKVQAQNCQIFIRSRLGKWGKYMEKKGAVWYNTTKLCRCKRIGDYKVFLFVNRLRYAWVLSAKPAGGSLLMHFSDKVKQKGCSKWIKKMKSLPGRWS